KRHRVASSISNVELSDVLGSIAKHPFRLDVHLPLAAKPVEVIDERTTHERLDRPIHIPDVDTLFDHLVAIDDDELLRHVGQEGGDDGGEFRTLARGGEELVRIAGEKR